MRGVSKTRSCQTQMANLMRVTSGRSTAKEEETSKQPKEDMQERRLDHQDIQGVAVASCNWEDNLQKYEKAGEGN